MAIHESAYNWLDGKWLPALIYAILTCAGRGILFVFVALIICLGPHAYAQDATTALNGNGSEIQPADEQFYVSVRTESPRRTFIGIVRRTLLERGRAVA